MVIEKFDNRIEGIGKTRPENGDYKAEVKEILSALSSVLNNLLGKFTQIIIYWFSSCTIALH